MSRFEVYLITSRIQYVGRDVGITLQNSLPGG